MSDKEKGRAKAEQVKGRLKELVGRALGNERMTAEGRAEKAKGNARQAKEKIKDVFKG
ncbi:MULTISPECIES: CsbD family protein [unclassified Streptomyces]|uniref:CsbD family protein n=1 Tax=unclassified Streptomyces TaxID=2593676 RepID=UPI001E626318|nr:CsbD family protein [Streptomyces sp. MBT42]MCD2462640.1 CsbD family protein [Streptomyces sp. MBT42]